LKYEDKAEVVIVDSPGDETRNVATLKALAAD
jgi:hypothetical protein